MIVNVKNLWAALLLRSLESRCCFYILAKINSDDEAT